jgi:hypothetical protein
MKLHIDWQYTIIDDITAGKITYILVFIFLSGSKEENKEKLENFVLFNVSIILYTIILYL